MSRIGSTSSTHRLPHSKAWERIDEYAEMAERLIDLSGDFRLRDPAEYEHWYGHAHPHPEWLQRFVYGLPEFHREDLVGARYASGGGCNAMDEALIGVRAGRVVRADNEMGRTRRHSFYGSDPIDHSPG